VAPAVERFVKRCDISKGRMFTLFHHPFCPHSRFVRLVLGEYGIELRLVEERAWERREAFLALNPAGTTPVLIDEGRPAIPGAGIIAEYLDETLGAEMGERRLLPTTIGERIEVRRLMAWFNEKFFEEATNPLVTERIYKRFMSENHGGGAPATDVIRAAKTNVRYHLAYIGWLARTRNFLAGERLTYADLAAGLFDQHARQCLEPRLDQVVIVVALRIDRDRAAGALLQDRKRIFVGPVIDAQHDHRAHGGPKHARIGAAFRVGREPIHVAMCAGLEEFTETFCCFLGRIRLAHADAVETERAGLAGEPILEIGRREFRGLVQKSRST